MLNLTRYDIVVKDIDGSCFTIPPSGHIARIDGVTMPYTRHFGKVIGMPDDDKPCIVSSLVLEALRILQPWRRNVFAPDIGPTEIRNEDGKIVAVRQFMNIQSIKAQS